MHKLLKLPITILAIFSLLVLPIAPVQALGLSDTTENITILLRTVVKRTYANDVNLISERPPFVRIYGNEVVLKPGNKKIIGDHTLVVQDSVTDEIHTINISVVLPEVDWTALRNEIKRVSNGHIGKYGIKIIDLKRDRAISFNQYKTLPPASISKVPVAVLMLRDIDNGVFSFEDEYPIKKQNKPYFHDVMSKYPNGTMVTVEKYLRYSLINSDNTANATLEDMLGGSEIVNQRITDELGVGYFFRKPHQAKANAVAKVFRGIEEGAYLEPDTNKFLKGLMLNTAPWLQDGIPARLPEKARVAHKTGQLPFYVWEDAAIVYGKDTDFVIVFLNNGITYKQARNFVRRVSNYTYQTLNNAGV